MIRVFLPQGKLAKTSKITKIYLFLKNIAFYFQLFRFHEKTTDFRNIGPAAVLDGM